MDLIHRNLVPLFYIHTFITYNNFNAVFFKRPIQNKKPTKNRKKNLKMYNVLCSKGYRQAFTNMYTHTQGLRTAASLSCTFNRSGLNERNSVTVEKKGTLNPQCIYKTKSSTLTRVYARSERTKKTNCKLSLMKNEKQNQRKKNPQRSHICTTTTTKKKHTWSHVFHLLVVTK